MSDIRLHIEVRGAVQGVGFRPTVYRYACEAGVSGFVTNDSSGVQIEVQGPEQTVRELVDRLRECPPPAAAISAFSAERVPLVLTEGFEIRTSSRAEDVYISIPPDLDLCSDCRREMLDPHDRRYLYPFTNCTNCGPRFTITRAMPYDRPQTTMSDFTLCADCSREYSDPMNRRFHAQPVACPACGPEVWLELPGRDGQQRISGAAAVIRCREILASGGIVAVRGLGGFHLACDAMNREAVKLLRRRKKRPGKPFAVMCSSLNGVSKIARVSPQEEMILSSSRRPIVLLRSTGGEPAETVAPGNCRVGVMLAYTPLHFLLLGAGREESGPEPFQALVMTSGNRRDEPICRSNQEALKRLAGIADAWLLHNREIYNRADDSIVVYAAGSERITRRARGYVPRPVKLGVGSDRTVLGVGGEMKGGFCLLRGRQAYVSQYLGELGESGNVDFYREALVRFIGLLGTEPEVIACDLHPDYFTSRLARSWPRELPGYSGNGRVQRLVEVQHHYAHALSVLAELGEEAPDKAVAVILDGTGFGEDGSIWGGEFLLVDRRSCEWKRLAHLQPLELIGGDRAVQEPWRQAYALVRRACGREVPKILRQRFVEVAGGEGNLEAMDIMLDRGLNSPKSSGAGRLFDAVGYLVAGRARISFEAQAAMEVEALAMKCPGRIEPYRLDESKPHGEGPRRLDPDGLIRVMLEDLSRGRDQREVAAAFQLGLAESCAVLAANLAEEQQASAVLLSGGCFQNALLLDQVSAALERRGVRWYANREVPANDGGVALGQVYAAARIRED